jgi:rSAM/selenodomain-associated transferase 2
MPSAPPRLSIIVPVLDEAPIVATALQRLAPDRGAGAEIIVVDGGSADGSAALAARGADRVIAAPRGRARQMNAGAAQARGDVLLFLHVDTALPAGALEAIDAALAVASPRGAPPAWGRFDVRIDGNGRLLGVVAALMNLRSRLSGIATGDQAIFVTRAAFEAVGGFPEQPLMEDIELSRRLRRLSRPACLRLRVVTSGRRWETRGVWRTSALMWRLRLLYRLGIAPERLARSYR